MSAKPSGVRVWSVLGQVLRRFAPRLRAHRGRLGVAVGGLGMEILLRLAEPWALKFVFDALLMTGPGRFPAGREWVEAVGGTTALTGVAGAVVVLALGRALAAYASTVGFAQVGSAVLSEVRGELFRHLQGLSLAFHQRSRQGDLVMRVINDVSLLQDVLVTALVPLLARSLVLAGMVGLMFVLNWRLALLAASVLPLFWIRGLRLSRGIHEAARRQRRREGDLAATAAESFGAVAVVQALSLGRRFAASFGDRNQHALREDVRGKRLSARLERSVDVCIAVASALVLWQGTRLVWAGELSPGDLLVFLAYLKTAFRPLQDSAKYTARLAKAAAAAERVLALLDEEPGVRDVAGARTAPALSGDLRFTEVTFQHRQGDGRAESGLRGVSFSIPAGSLVAVIGPSGSGKSTLLSLVARLVDPARGSVQVDGVDLRDYTLDSLRPQVGFVLQDTGLFAASVRDNLLAGGPAVSEAELEAAARLACADDFIRRLPEGYDTVLGERGVTLSQGQRQRLAVARAALRRTPLLLLDEPTAGLDEANGQAVFQALRRLAEGRTTLLVTHDPAQAAQADWILELRAGRLVWSGRPSDRLAAPDPARGGTGAAVAAVEEEPYALRR